MSSLFNVSFPRSCTETFSSVEPQFRIIAAVLRNKVQKKLNIAPGAKSFSPMFDLGSGVNAAIALEHFDPSFAEVRWL